VVGYGSGEALALALAGSVALRVPASDLNARTMAPTLLALTGASLCLLHAVELAWFDRTWAVRAVAFAGLAAVLAQGPATYQLAVDLNRDGLGYTSQTWVESGTIEGIRHLDSDIVLISNETAAILLLTNRPAYDVPELQKGQRLTSFLCFGDGSEGAKQAFRNGGVWCRPKTSTRNSSHCTAIKQKPALRLSRAGFGSTQSTQMEPSTCPHWRRSSFLALQVGRRGRAYLWPGRPRLSRTSTAHCLGE